MAKAAGLVWCVRTARVSFIVKWKEKNICHETVNALEVVLLSL